jgi:hypothetical protein
MNNFILTGAIASGLLLGALSAKAQTPAVYQAVSIIGSATAGGWSTDTPMRLTSASDVHNWTVTLPLLAGASSSNEVKFRANNDWTVNWGGNAFPTGAGIANGPSIVIPTTNTYTVQFNDVTGAYRFIVGALASKVGSGASLALALYPNPASTATTLTGTALGAAVQVVDALGRTVAVAVADATGTAALTLPAHALAGVYVVRTGNKSLRLAVE